MPRRTTKQRAKRATKEAAKRPIRSRVVRLEELKRLLPARMGTFIRDEGLAALRALLSAAPPPALPSPLATPKGGR